MHGTIATVATWAEVMRESPVLAVRAQERFDAQRHKLLATLRREGAPRLSGVEVTFAQGEIWLGMMPGSRKGADLRRDPRLALHSSSPDADEDDPAGWPGDAKISGSATQVLDKASRTRFVEAQKEMPPGPFELFRVDIEELTVIRVGDPPDHLVIETWNEGRGTRRVERR
jgi:hypothetical protein